MKSSYRESWLYVLLFVMLVLLVPRAGFDFDVNCWSRWATYGYENGLGNMYKLPDNSYTPLYQYVLWGYAQLMGSVEKIDYYKHGLKIFTLLFDFAGAIMMSRLGGRARQFSISLLLLFNIGYLYDTLIWVQVDAIFTTLAAAAVLLAVAGRTGPSLWLFVLAINMKPQAIIFLPPLGLLWLLRWATGNWRAAVPAVLGAAALQLLILAPFMWGGEQNGLPRILTIAFKATDFFPFITMNAFNLWYIIQPESGWAMLSSTEDTTVGAIGLTYRQWGLLLFMVASAVALTPLLVLVLRNWLARRLPTTDAEKALVLLSCALLPLIFTYFNTQMHERYWHPALLFLAGYGFLTRRYGLLILVSVAYFLQLEVLLRYLQVQKYTVLVFDPYFIAGLFTIAVVWAFAELYWQAARLGLWTPGFRALEKLENPDSSPLMLSQR